MRPIGVLTDGLAADEPQMSDDGGSASAFARFDAHQKIGKKKRDVVRHERRVLQRGEAHPARAKKRSLRKASVF